MGSILFLLRKFRENLLNALYSFESPFRYLERRPSVLAGEALATAPYGAVWLMRPAVEDFALFCADRAIHGDGCSKKRRNSLVTLFPPGIPSSASRARVLTASIGADAP
jgi:hypothetical protein